MLNTKTVVSHLKCQMCLARTVTTSDYQKGEGLLPDRMVDRRRPALCQSPATAFYAGPETSTAGAKS